MPFESMGHARMRHSSERRQRDDMILIPETVFRFWAVHKKHSRKEAHALRHGLVWRAQCAAKKSAAARCATAK